MCQNFTGSETPETKKYNIISFVDKKLKNKFFFSLAISIVKVEECHHHLIDEK